MLLTSSAYLLFFLFGSIVYFVLPVRWRWLWLLGCSYIFYLTYNSFSLLLLVATSFITYLLGVKIGKAPLNSVRNQYLFLSLTINIGIIFLFKYTSFFYQSFRDVLGFSIPLPPFTAFLSVGISFYIFKCISYIMDVYRGNLNAELHFGRFALYVAFFPQLLAGPIERATRLLPQFYQKSHFDYQRVTDGAKLILWGFFQKMVIADNMAKLVDVVYNQPYQYEGAPLALATFFYSFQIYCDFAGYSNIAIGSAQVLGFTTIENFNRPYFATSVPEFWRRWHISLSTWFRDYLYLPLGGSRVSPLRRSLNLALVMLLCGLWHGANWTFIVWGLLHGFYLVMSGLTRDMRGRICRWVGLDKWPRLHRILCSVICFVLVCLAWIFFRANSLSDALYIFTHLFIGWGNMSQNFSQLPFWTGMKFEWWISIVSLGVLLGIEGLGGQRPFVCLLKEKPIWVRWAYYHFLLLSVLLFGEFGSKPFIYFQF